MSNPANPLEKNEEKVEITKADLDAFKERITNLEGSTQGLKEDKARLEGELSAKNETPPVAPGPTPDPITKEQFNEEMVADPLAALDKYTAAKLGPIVAQGQAATANTQRKMAEKENPEIFEKYGKEIDALEKTIQPALLGQPGAYDYLVKQVKSNHVDDLVKEEVEKQMKAKDNPPPPQVDLSLSPGPGGPRKELDERPPSEQLTETEREVAKGLGVSDEDYLKFQDPNAELLPEESP